MSFALLGADTGLWLLYQTVSSFLWGQTKSNIQKCTKSLRLLQVSVRTLLLNFPVTLGMVCVMTPGTLLNIGAPSSLTEDVFLEVPSTSLILHHSCERVYFTAVRRGEKELSLVDGVL